MDEAYTDDDDTVDETEDDMMIMLMIMVTRPYDHAYDTDDDTDDGNYHKKDSYTAAGAAPTQTRPGHARPGRAKPGQARPSQAKPGQARPPKYFMFSLFRHEWASDRLCEVLDSSIMKIFRVLSI